MVAEPFDAPGRFGPMAPRYEEAFTASTGLRSISERELAIVAQRLGDVRGRRVLDAGVGTGRIARHLTALGASVVGLDVTPEMLDQCRKVVPGALAVQARVGPHLPFADRSVDDVVSVRVFKYVGHWAPTFRELRRVLRPGGRLLVEVTNARSLARWGYPGDPISFATTAEADRLLRDAGFLPTAVDAGTRLPFGVWARSGERATAVLDAAERAAGRFLGGAVFARSFFVTAELID